MSKIKKQALLLVFYTFAIQIFFFAAANFFQVGRTIINIDYFFALLLVFANLAILAYTYIIFMMLVDAFMILVQILPFTRAADFIYFSRKLEYINSDYIYSAIILISIIIVFSLLFISQARKTNKIYLLVFFNIAIFSFYFSGFLKDDVNDNRFYRVDSVPFIDSVFLYAYTYRTSGFVNTFQLKDQKFESTAYERSFCKHANCTNPKNKKIFFILNESWGDYKNSEINKFLTKNIRDKFNTTLSYSNFTGPTVAAELKELCGLETNSFYLKEVTNKSLESCFPNKLKEQGWKTFSYHGAGSSMYDRFFWYGKAGFEKSYFYDNYDWKQRCYSFPGACDIEVSKKILSDINKTDKGFFYWLTLNTHHNYNLKDLSFDVLNCSRFSIENNEVCRNTKLQHQFFLLLESMVNELKGENIIIYVLGDHVPQVVNKDDKEKYFNINQVPWLKLDLNNSLEL